MCQKPRMVRCSVQEFKRWAVRFTEEAWSIRAFGTTQFGQPSHLRIIPYNKQGEIRDRYSQRIGDFSVFAQHSFVVTTKNPRVERDQLTLNGWVPCKWPLRAGGTVWVFSSVWLSSVAQSCPTLCDPMNHSTPSLPVHHQLPEFTQTHAHRVSDAIQPSHPLSSPSPPAPNPSQHQGLFQ